MLGIILFIVFIVIAIVVIWWMYNSNVKYNPSKARSELIQIFRKIALNNQCHQAAEVAVQDVTAFKQKYPNWLTNNIKNMSGDEVMQKGFIYANARLNSADCKYPLAMLLNQ